MIKPISNVDNIKIKKSAFHNSEYPADPNQVDIIKILISDKVSFGKKAYKYFFGYKDEEKVNPLCMMVTKMSG